MSLLLIEIVVILLLLVLNGLFSMTEMAVVAARRRRLRIMAAEGNAGAQAALRLVESPNRFLSSIQLGITLIGLLAGAFGGITIAEAIAARLKPFPAVADYAEAIGLGVVVVFLTYFSLIIGELVPKRLALANPEVIASRMARPMDLLSRITRPIVWVLGVSTDLVLRCFGERRQRTSSISDEDIKTLLREGVKSGVFHQTEPRMIESVLAFDQRPIREIMTPRERLIVLHANDPHDILWERITGSGHSNFPIVAGHEQQIVGVVSVKAIYAKLAAGASVVLTDLMQQPLFIPANLTVTQLLDAFRQTHRHIALVTGEDGRVVGLVTLVDILEAIVGDMPSSEELRRSTFEKSL